MHEYAHRFENCAQSCPIPETCDEYNLARVILFKNTHILYLNNVCTNTHIVLEKSVREGVLRCVDYCACS